MDFGVYVHVPFCRVHCPYCTFYTIRHPEAGAMDGFMAAVLAEWRLRVAPRLARGDRLRTLYLGGGTPSDVTPDGWDRWLDAIRASLGAEGLRGLDECTMECNPESTSDALLDVLERHGVGRISLGVQALDDADLHRIGRAAGAAEVRAALDRVAARFPTWNADLLVGIPESPPERLQAAADELVARRAPHLSFYCIELPPGLEQRFGRIPDEDKAARYEALSRQITAAGYEHYEISNAALPGHRAAHNEAYWEGREYLGLGPGAHSLADGVRRANRPDWRAYVAALRRGDLPPGQAETLTPAMRRREAVLLGLRRRVGLDLGAVGLPAALPLLERLQDAGLGTVEEGRLRLTPKGWMVSDSIALQLVTEAGLA